jgi:hypothetical protein
LVRGDNADHRLGVLDAQLAKVPTFINLDDRKTEKGRKMKLVVALMLFISLLDRLSSPLPVGLQRIVGLVIFLYLLLSAYGVLRWLSRLSKEENGDKSKNRKDS